MRCLLVADLHYSLPKFDWLLKAASGFDLVVLAGDALDIGSTVDYRAQTIVVRKYLQRVSKITRLLVCSGNHDLDSQSERGEKVALVGANATTWTNYGLTAGTTYYYRVRCQTGSVYSAYSEVALAATP